jgi:RNA polymerase sigma factor (sigma-70 family)
MPTPLAQVAGADMRKALARAIDELPAMQKQALVMFSLQKMPQKQVAQILECSVEAVKWHVFTARKKLKNRLADL